jgi:uncharacterized protein YndB with AHSA1/START domain
LARKIRIERTFRASVDEVWDLWTTRSGIESWWGPGGFEVKVRELDLRPGGELVYLMTATAADQVDFMKKAGMPVTTEHRIVYTEVSPRKRLAYRQVADFIPGVEPYDIATVVEFEPGAEAVRMVLTFDAMHDEQWTRMALVGHESELDKLARLLGS